MFLLSSCAATDSYCLGLCKVRHGEALLPHVQRARSCGLAGLRAAHVRGMSLLSGSDGAASPPAPRRSLGATSTTRTKQPWGQAPGAGER